MKILIFGAGAIGSVLGGFLSRDHEVTLLGRKPHLESIRQSGLQVSGIWGNHRFRNFQLISDTAQLIRSKSSFDLVLVTVKSYDTISAARAVGKMISPQTIVVSLQNGLDNFETLCRFMPARQVMAARVIFGVVFRKPGKVKVTVMAEPTAVGEYSEKKISKRARVVADLLNRAGVPTVAAADIRSFLWAKVIYNSALNPLASLLETHYGALSEFAETRLIMEEVIREIYGVAKALRIRLKPRSAGAYAKLFYSRLVPRTYNHHPSMLQDLQKGKKTEIDSINGAIVKYARRAGIKVPANEKLVRLIRLKEKLS